MSWQCSICGFLTENPLADSLDSKGFHNLVRHGGCGGRMERVVAPDPLLTAARSLQETADSMFQGLTDKEKALVRNRFKKKEGA